jgi:hypothetical protein
MDTSNWLQDIAPSHEPEAQRSVIRPPLNEIAAEVGAALRDAHLDFPVYLTVPNSGDAVATVACPLDPTDEDWSQASAIVCRVMGKRLGDVKLQSNGLICAVAGPKMSAGDVISAGVAQCTVTDA